MFEKPLAEVYMKFKLNFYRSVLSRFEKREASLTTVETFCAEVIYALDKPTIGQFSDFVRISQANASYKIQNLIKKGYIQKVQSERDRREFQLVPTEKFHKYYDINQRYLAEVSTRIRNRFSPEKIAVFAEVLDLMSEELMPEVNLSEYKNI